MGNVQASIHDLITTGQVDCYIRAFDGVGTAIFANPKAAAALDTLTPLGAIPWDGEPHPDIPHGWKWASLNLRQTAGDDEEEAVWAEGLAGALGRHCRVAFQAGDDCRIISTQALHRSRMSF